MVLGVVVTLGAVATLGVLVVTADNMTGELLKSSFAHGRKGFTVETLTGSSQKIIGELGSHKADVTLISEELQDGPEAGIKVLQKTRDSHGTAAIMLLQSSKPERVVNAFRDGARGVFYRSHSLKSLSKCIQTVHKGQIWASNEDIEHLLNALTQIKPLHLNNSHGMPLLTRREEEVVRLVADGLKNREIASDLRLRNTPSGTTSTESSKSWESPIELSSRSMCLVTGTASTR